MYDRLVAEYIDVATEKQRTRFQSGVYGEL